MLNELLGKVEVLKLQNVRRIIHKLGKLSICFLRKEV